MPNVILSILVILLVIFIFNVIIFVHELGHFLAARWRGLEVERFQIWFGKPFWKKTYNGVQYGIGWLPFGGFVALPQMAPMEAIEGSNENKKPLPPVKPIDKIIVAFAGPLFSFLLAFATALVVWQVGKPDSRINTTTIGYVENGSPAMKAGLRPNDTILAINGKKVDCFDGSMDTGVVANIITSEGSEIQFLIKRKGEEKPITITSTFNIPKTAWYKRSGMRKVGITFKEKVEIGTVLKNSPAEIAGIKKGDIITQINGKPVTARIQLIKAALSGKPTQLTVKRGNQEIALSITAQKPLPPNDKNSIFGMEFKFDESVISKTTNHPKPWQQIKDAAGMMKRTLALVSSRKSSIGIDQLAGPIGIGKGYFQMLTMPEGWKLALSFTVLFNINLAILNMLPFPVLDGGHITLSLLEIIFRRPVKAKVLEFIQTLFVLLILGLFIYITSKDVGSFFGSKKKANTEVKFAPPQGVSNTPQK